MHRTILAALTILMAAFPAQAENLPNVEVYKSPFCGCCAGWVDHMRDSGFPVTVRDLEDISMIKRKAGVPERLDSCHTAMVDGYLIEGHVPASDIKRLLQLRPEGRGLAVPGMPIGSPGMEQGDQHDPFDVILLGSSEGGEVFSHHPGR
jgi:hypothetical protein